MKRSPLRRMTPLTAKTRLKRGAANLTKKVSAATLRNKCDARLSRILRGIVGRCEIRGSRCGGRTDVALQVHHLIGRQAMYYRYNPKNLVCVCGGCHILARQNSAKFLSLLQALKPAQYEWLQEHCHKIYPNFWKAAYYPLVSAWLDTVIVGWVGSIEHGTTAQELWDMPTWQELDVVRKDTP